MYVAARDQTRDLPFARASGQSTDWATGAGIFVKDIMVAVCWERAVRLAFHLC